MTTGATFHITRAVLFVFVVGVLIGCGKEKPLSFTVTFSDAKNLQQGQFLVYKGIRIGEVISVGLDEGGAVRVDVTVDDKYRTTVYQEAEFSIEKPSGVVDLSGERQLTMNDRSGVRTPLKGGEIIVGSEGGLDHWINKIKDAGTDIWEAVKGFSSNVGDLFGKSDSSSEGQEFLKALSEYAGRAKDMSKDQFEEFSQRTLPDLEKKAEGVRERLEKEGKKEQAQQFWEDFNRWAVNTLREKK
jgi:hypothetical protein